MYFFSFNSGGAHRKPLLSPAIIGVAAAACFWSPLSAQSLEVSPYHQWTGPPQTFTYFAESVAGGVDINADGFDDLMVSSPNEDVGGITDAGLVRVYSGFDGSILYSLTETWGYTYGLHFGSSLSGLKDVNGDGHDEFMVGHQVSLPGLSGAVRVYSGIDGSILHTINGVWGDYIGRTIKDVGDINQDGIHDFAFCTERSTGGTQDVFIHSGLDASLIYQWAIPDALMELSLDAAGDVNGDGVPDVIVGAPNYHWPSSTTYGAIFVYSGIDGSLLLQKGGGNHQLYLGTSVAGVGDVNGDGYADVMAGAPGNYYSASGVFIWSGFDGSELYAFTSSVYGVIGSSVSGAGDFNQDGFDDFLVSRDDYTSPVLWVRSGKTGEILRGLDDGLGTHTIGRAIARAGDVNGDGLPDVIAGDKFYLGGKVTVFSHFGKLTSSTSRIYASFPSAVQLTVQFPPHAANHEYKILLSAAGGGLSDQGVALHLIPDSFTTSSFRNIYPVPNAIGMQGVLDGNGKASATFHAAAGFFTRAVGRTVHAVAIANAPGSTAYLATSNASISIRP